MVLASLSLVPMSALGDSPPQAPPPKDWDKCKGEPLNLSSEQIYVAAIREFERVNGRLAPDNHRITVQPNGCTWWVQFVFVPRDARGKFGVVIEKVTGKASWSGWLDV
jgi:hypothetical protein